MKTLKLKQITKNNENGTEWLHSSEIIDNPETLVWALKKIKATYIENRRGIFTTLENLKRVERYCIKYDVLIKIDFTKEEYEEKTDNSCAIFDEFIDKIVEDTIENEGSVYDAVFVANDAYSKL